MDIFDKDLNTVTKRLFYKAAEILSMLREEYTFYYKENAKYEMFCKVIDAFLSEYEERIKSLYDFVFTMPLDDYEADATEKSIKDILNIIIELNTFSAIVNTNNEYPTFTTLFSRNPSVLRKTLEFLQEDKYVKKNMLLYMNDYSRDIIDACDNSFNIVSGNLGFAIFYERVVRVYGLLEELIKKNMQDE